MAHHARAGTCPGGSVSATLSFAIPSARVDQSFNAASQGRKKERLDEDTAGTARYCSHPRLPSAEHRPDQANFDSQRRDSRPARLHARLRSHIRQQRMEPYLWWDVVVKARLCSGVRAGGSLCTTFERAKVFSARAPSLT
jgi:hypothetical protein